CTMSRWIGMSVVVKYTLMYYVELTDDSFDSFFFQEEEGIRDPGMSRELGDMDKRQLGKCKNP
ncbi:hypothetical protein ACISMS_08855, partial [Campylobacter jejuni]